MANTSIYNAFERMWLHVVAKLGDKANAEHTHDDIYYTETEVDSLLGNKADATHNHDDVYYTQAQMDEALADVEQALSEKANSSHAHAIADVTNLQTTLDTKAAQTSLDAHTGNADIHFTAAERTKLSGIEEAANHTVVDTALSASSENPVQNKVVNSAISTLTSTVSANTSSISAHTTSINNLQTAVSEIQEITSEEVQALFNS